MPGASNEKDANLTGPRKSSVNNVLRRVLRKAQDQGRSHWRPDASAGDGNERAVSSDLKSSNISFASVTLFSGGGVKVSTKAKCDAEEISTWDGESPTGSVVVAAKSWV